MSGEEHANERNVGKIQAIELRRLAICVLEVLDERRRVNDDSQSLDARGRTSEELHATPLDLALMQHWKSMQQELRLIAPSAAPATYTGRAKETYILGVCAEFGLACALDGAQLDPNAIPQASDDSPFVWDTSQAASDPQPMMHLIELLQPALEGLHKAHEEIGVIQNRYAVGATSASDPSLRSLHESRAIAVGELKDFASKAGPILIQLMTAASSRPSVRRDLRVPPLIALSPSDFERRITEMLRRLRAAGLDDDALKRLAHKGTSNPPKDPDRSLAKRLDRLEAQRKLPTKR